MLTFNANMKVAWKTVQIIHIVDVLLIVLLNCSSEVKYLSLKQYN